MRDEGAPTARLSEQEQEDLFELLPVTLQQAVARGDVDLEEVLERVTDAHEAELCPRCAMQPVSPRYARLGLCVSCARKALNTALEERIYELETQREAVRLRKTVQRLRDETEPDRRRHANGATVKTAADYGRATLVTTSEALPLVRCEHCERLIRQHTAEQALCVACSERDQAAVL